MKKITKSFLSSPSHHSTALNWKVSNRYCNKRLIFVEPSHLPCLLVIPLKVFTNHHYLFWLPQLIYKPDKNLRKVLFCANCVSEECLVTWSYARTQAKNVIVEFPASLTVDWFFAYLKLSHEFRPQNRALEVPGTIS